MFTIIVLIVGYVAGVFTPQPEAARAVIEKAVARVKEATAKVGGK